MIDFYSGAVQIRYMKKCTHQQDCIGIVHITVSKGSEGYRIRPVCNIKNLDIIGAGIYNIQGIDISSHAAGRTEKPLPEGTHTGRVFGIERQVEYFNIAGSNIADIQKIVHKTHKR